ncbi:MAG: ACT domain-containing protein [Ruminococcaceae bacterium]|nr:ACT domain-containing protein [Oscillospiraceae bacterium]
MFIKQLSIFVENKVGRLQDIVNALGENEVNISALSIADTTDFGILRIIVDNPDKAKLVLKGMGVISKTTDVVAVYIDDRSGGLAAVLNLVSNAGIGIEYMYAFLGRTEGKALMVLKADNEEMLEQVLTRHGVELAKPDEI